MVSDFDIFIKWKCISGSQFALCELHSSVNNKPTTLMTFSLYLVVNLKSVLPKFYQHVDFATRRNNTLDRSETTQSNVKHKHTPCSTDRPSSIQVMRSQPHGTVWKNPTASEQVLCWSPRQIQITEL